MITREDGTPMKGKGKQFVPHGGRVMLSFPGGAGYGKSADRDPKLVERDLARGYISGDVAENDYGMSVEHVAAVIEKVKNGETI